MRWPAADQPGEGGKVGGVTGLSSSEQTIVTPSGGAVEWATTSTFVGQSRCPYSPPSCGSAASTCP